MRPVQLQTHVRGRGRILVAIMETGLLISSGTVTGYGFGYRYVTVLNLLMGFARVLPRYVETRKGKEAP
jgi:hypothetical protein